jgi:uncharacterized SAM-binding protein YcdF (DUF218 family)
MFLFKKIFSSVFLPLSLCIEFLFVGIILLLLTKKQKAAKTIISIGTILLVLFGFRFFAYWLLSPLEQKYSPLKESTVQHKSYIKWVVVLGGGHTSNPKYPVTSQISKASLARLIEGIRLYREIPGCKLLLSGGMTYDSTSDAEIMFQVAKDIGIDQNDLVLEAESKDTEDEARLIQPMIGNDKFILVTSAAHMPRSVGLFTNAGLIPIPAPTDYTIKSELAEPAHFFPTSQALVQTQNAFYEYMGIAWAKLRGKM